jgi:hypothetical protein
MSVRSDAVTILAVASAERIDTAVVSPRSQARTALDSA